MSEQATVDKFFDIIASNHFVILDTETTGLKRPAEICQIAICAFTGDKLLNTLVKPIRKIPLDAQRIHGITDEMVANAPSWKEVKERVLEYISGMTVIVYNATYDRHMMHSSDEQSQLPKTNYHDYAEWQCAMLWYADIRGEYDEYHGNNRWHKLTSACVYEGIPIESAHDAMGDVQMTYKLIRKLQSDRAKSNLQR